MAFLKFSRDKRGYENFYLLQPSVRGKSRPRLLYWFRTPPNVKVGRTTPFDPDVRRALEAQNPDVAFDWTAIVQTPIPPADTERWRERRRFERAMRSASESENDEETAQDEPAPQRPMERETAPLMTVATTEVLTVPPAEPGPNPTTEAAAASNLSAAPEVPGASAHRRRRRRRGRRKGQGPAAKDSAGPEVPQIDSTANEPDEPEDDGNIEP